MIRNKSGYLCSRYLILSKTAKELIGHKKDIGFEPEELEYLQSLYQRYKAKVDLIKTTERFEVRSNKEKQHEVISENSI